MDNKQNHKLPQPKNSQADKRKKSPNNLNKSKHTNQQNQRNFAFIDSQNLNLGVKYSGWELDFGKFRLFLRNKYNIKKAFIFIGYIEENASLYKYLQDCGFILIFKNVLEIRKEEKTTYKGNVDAELVLHTMIEYPNYHQAVIVSGDGDFYCLVEYLESQNKLLKVITPNKKHSSLLKKYAKYIYPIVLSKKKLSKVNKRNGDKGKNAMKSGKSPVQKEK